MRFAIIGCGHAGRRHAEQFKQIEGATLVACCDSHAEATAAFARDYAVQGFARVDELLAIPLDGLTICTPPRTHAAIVNAALAAGVRTLCEKPLATDVDGCLEIHDAEGLACAFKFRHLSGARMLREMIAAGELGAIVAVRGTAVSDADMRGKWFSDPTLSGGGVLIDNGVHLIDLCRYLVGPIESVSATISGGSRDLYVEESATINMRLSCGAAANLWMSWESPAPMPPLMEIYGTAGYARVGYETQVFDKSRKLIRQIPAEGVDVWREVIADFVSYVAGRTAPRATFDDGVAAVAAAEAAYRSIETGAWERPRCGVGVES